MSFKAFPVFLVVIEIIFFFLSFTTLKDHSQTKWSRAQLGKRLLSNRAVEEPLIYPGTATVPANHSGDLGMIGTLVTLLIQRIYFIILISLAFANVLSWRFRHSFYAMLF